MGILGIMGDQVKGPSLLGVLKKRAEPVPDPARDWLFCVDYFSRTLKRSPCAGLPSGWVMRAQADHAPPCW